MLGGKIKDPADAPVSTQRSILRNLSLTTRAGTNPQPSSNTPNPHPYPHYPPSQQDPSPPILHPTHPEQPRRHPRPAPRPSRTPTPPKSPHVIRAWETKRALTPGRERRKSARWHLHTTHARDSPIDILKQLSFQLAPKSRPFYLDATPKPTPRASLVSAPGSARRESVVFNYHSDPEGLDDEEDGDGDDEFPPPPSQRGRRLSFDLDATGNGKFTSMPGLSATLGNGAPHSTEAEDSSLNDSTLDDSLASMELPRRAPPDSYRYNRMSFGFRLSDNFADLEELGAGDESLLHHMAGGRDKNIWEGLDMGDSTGDLNRRFLLDEEAAAGEIGGLYEDSIGGFQLIVPGFVPDKGGERNGGEDGEESGDEDAGGDRMDIDSEGEGDEQEGDDDDEHSIRLGEAHSKFSPTIPFSDLDEPGFPNQARPLYTLSLPDNDVAEQTITHPPWLKTKQSASTKSLRKTKPPSTKPLKLSRYNLPIPSLPPRLIKKLATNFAGSAGKGISNETLTQIIKASDIFFENACVRLGEYAEHAGRKTVGEGDVELLMKRQRILNPQNTMFSLAEKYLPRELLQEIRMPVQGGAGGKKRRAAAVAGRSSRKLKGKGKARALDDGVEEEEEEEG
ncbi:centromere kinetochore component CENP-T-domain-containing protein [Terfezia claveryi]|nr:centromere kinetochore component CENP-T-domain-containing protein [Terfezia claveryi]